MFRFSALLLTLFAMLMLFGANSNAGLAYEYCSTNETCDSVNKTDASPEALDSPKCRAFGVFTSDISKYYAIVQREPGVVHVWNMSNPLSCVLDRDISVGSLNVHIALTPDKDAAYICSLDEGMIYGLDTLTNTVVSSIVVGGQPNYIAFTPDGSKAYVTDSTRTTISSLDLKNKEVIASIDVGSPSRCVAIAPDGLTAYVVRDGSPTGFVSSINVASDTVENDFVVSEHDSMIAIAPDGRTAYLINDTTTVDVMNLETGTLEPPTTLQLPFQGSVSVIVASDGSGAFFGSCLGDMCMIDLSTNSVLRSITHEDFRKNFLHNMGETDKP